MPKGYLEDDWGDPGSCQLRVQSREWEYNSTQQSILGRRRNHRRFVVEEE
jgi:hypothetical protein